MIFISEKKLIRIAAILGGMGIVIMGFLYIFLHAVKNVIETRRPALYNLIAHHITRNYFILTVLSILVVILLLVIANKLNENNYKIVGFSLIILAIFSIKLLWFVPVILIFIAGVLVLVKGRKWKET